jgi:hypothetical protein
MKKQNLKALKLNKKSISIIDANTSDVKGGRTYRCGASWITRCNISDCYCQ